MSDFKNRVSVVVKDINNHLSSDFCSGFPYLKLDQPDYAVKSLNNAYGEYARLIRSLAYEGNWKSNKVSFFDIHPVFSNAEPIPSLMGFHLSLMIFQKDIASATETLYFDTKSNWLKFSPVFENRALHVGSWIKYNRSEILDELDSDVNPDLFLPINVLLIKGSELSSISKQAPVKFDTNLLAWYEKDKQLKNNSDVHRQILLNELQIFKSAMSEVLLKDAGKFEDSALFLYALIFCREFGINHDVFMDVVTDHKLIFDFKSEADIIFYSQCCFYHLDSAKLRIGDYDKLALTQDQIDITLGVKANPPPTDATTQPSTEDFEKNSVKPLEEVVVNYHIQVQTKFYEMKKALITERDCRIEITRIWTRLVQCFYLDRLTWENFNLMRNLVDTHIIAAIKQFSVLKRSNYDIQYKVMQDVAYHLFMKVDAEFKTLSEDSFYLGEEVYKKITPPPLDDEQINTLNMMNSASQEKYLGQIHQMYKEDFIILLKSTIAKLAHSSTIKEHGARFQKLDNVSFRTIVLKWYIDNYIQSYLELDNSYDFIRRRVESDQARFNDDNYFKKSLLTEIKTFVKTQDNPFLLLDLNSPL